MPTTALASSELAVSGGAPIGSTPLAAPTWPLADEATAREVADTYLSGNWSFNGPREEKFAADFARAHDAKHGIFMANGTVTLQCALGALGIGPGDEVIVPALTWLATAMAAIYVGARPVFVDVDASTLCLDPDAFEAAITEKTRAVIPVHLYGGMPDMERVLDIARRNGIKVIEDCAHGHGGKWNGQGVGSWGDVGSFSFQQSKTMAAGEGGICLTNDDEIVERIFRMKHIGYALGTAQGKAEAGPPPGLLCHNFRGTEFQAAILDPQLRNLENRIALYNRNAAQLEERLIDVPGVRVQARGRLAAPQCYYSLCFIFDEEPAASVPLSRIHEAIQAEGLSLINNTYGSVYNHVLWNIAPQEYSVFDSCPIADGIGTQRTLALPHQWLGSDEQTIEAIGEIIAKVAENVEQLGAE